MKILSSRGLPKVKLDWFALKGRQKAEEIFIEVEGGPRLEGGIESETIEA
jgi:hypothetical protein